MKRLLTVLVLALAVLWPTATAPVKARRQAAVQAYKGSFAAATTVSTQDVTGIVDNGGNAFTPEFILLWSSNTTGTTFVDGFVHGVGVWSATGSVQAGAWCQAEDNSGTADARTMASETAIYTLASTAGTTQRVGNVSAVASGQFTMNWSTVNVAAAHVMHFVALATTGDISANVTDIYASGMALSTVAMVPTGRLNIYGGFSGTDCIAPALGFEGVTSTGTYTRTVASAFHNHNASTNDSKAYLVSGWSFFNFNTSGGIEGQGGADIHGTAYQTLGSSASINQTRVAFSGMQTKTGVALQPTSNGTQAITGVGFQPIVVVVAWVGAAASASITEGGQFVVGGADGTRQGYAGAASTDAAATSESVSIQNTNAMLISITPNATAGSSTINSSMAFSSFDSDGWTGNWTVTDATQRQFLWWAVGLPAAAAGEHSAVH